MPSVFRDPVGWTEKAVGSTGRFVFLCVATLGFWGLAMFGVHLAVRASVLYATTGESLSMLHKGVWILVYVSTFVGVVAVPIMYLIALHSLIFVVRTKPKKDKG